MILAAAPTAMDLASYGLGGLIFATMVLPMAVYILRDKDRQLAAKEAEIERKRVELADLRKALDPIAPALNEMGTTMRTAIQIISAGPR